MKFSQNTVYVPLAEQLRPTHWQEVVGQEHLLGQDKPLATAFKSKMPHSMILWGPPGSGKTSLARIAAHSFDAEWIALSAVLAGVKEIRAAVEQAKENALKYKITILFIDEIHRFNKAQQDALLPFTESGLIILIGATTENPSFEVNTALLSRAQVYKLRALTEVNLKYLIEQAQQKILKHLVLEDVVVDHIVQHADGDARRLYNLLEQINLAATVYRTQRIDLPFLEKIISASHRRFDKKGDIFYDQISALHKAVRGSHPDAALYWLMRMLDGGADPYYLSRRIIRMAWEDIGLADPRALQIANDAAATFERLGSPEGELALAQAVIYLAIAAKSNAGYLAFKEAQSFVKNHSSAPVPLHLRNAPTNLMKDLGYGSNYRYAHNEPHAYAAGASYMPEGMQEPAWYKPVNRGLEINISEKLAFLRQLDQKDKDKK